MKKILLFFLLSFIYAGSASALVQMDKDTIKDAQEYGVMHYHEEIPYFAKSWCVYEETSKSLDEAGERLYVYTPYYLVALNARERLLASQTINIVDGELVVREFQGIFPLCAVLYVENIANLEKDFSAELRQGDRSVFSYDTTVQDIVVVQTKTLPVEPINEKAKAPDESADKNGGNPRVRDGKEKTADLTVADEPDVSVKTIPVLYRVQLFFYFDAKEFGLSGQTILLVHSSKERDRKFNFSFAAMR